MPTYTYRCRSCPDFDVVLPISQLTDDQPCRQCGRPARRIITSPYLSVVPSAAGRIREAADASAEQPRVARRSPGPPHPPPPRDPRHATLPRW